MATTSMDYEATGERYDGKRAAFSLPTAVIATRAALQPAIMSSPPLITNLPSAIKHY